MAIRSIAQLKAWFKRGAYPTAEQFSDWLDSFFHKDEKVPVSSVDGLADRLNAKYDQTSGEQLEREHDQLAEDFQAHESANEVQFNNITDSIEELTATDEQLEAKIDSTNRIIHEANWSVKISNGTSDQDFRTAAVEFRFLDRHLIPQEELSKYAIRIDIYQRKRSGGPDRALEGRVQRRWFGCMPSPRTPANAIIGHPYFLSEYDSQEVTAAYLMGETTDHSDAYLRTIGINSATSKNGVSGVSIGKNRQGYSVLAGIEPAYTSDGQQWGYPKHNNDVVAVGQRMPVLYIRAAVVRYKGASSTPTMTQMASANERIWVSPIVGIICSLAANGKQTVKNGINSVQFRLAKIV